MGKTGINKPKISRRKFLDIFGKISTGVFITPYLKTMDFSPDMNNNSNFISQVAITEANNYDRTIIKQKVQHLFESPGGINDIVKYGKKEAIKINLTGGSGSASSSKLTGSGIQETMWTHPEIVRA